MTVLMEIKVADRNTLVPLFKECQYDRVLIDSAIEGDFSNAYADSVRQPMVARLASGAFTMLGGNPMTAGAKDLLHYVPICYVTPQDNEWRNLLQREFDTRISALPFTVFSPRSLDQALLGKFVSTGQPHFELERIDQALIEKPPSDLGNEYFFENFQLADDFLKRGI